MKPDNSDFTIAHIKELIAILEPYAVYWWKWIKSEDCFLTEKEVKVIRNYLLNRSHYISCITLNLSEAEASDVLANAKHRLTAEYPRFIQWLEKENLLDTPD